MCGIVACVPGPGMLRALEAARPAQERAVELLGFRGPDEQQIVDVGGAMFGHTRLSVIDLETGSQPLYNEDRTIAVVLNGEIYNYRELRRDLEANGHQFRTRSDTEVIAHLYEEEGEAVFGKLNGMFAILIWDRRQRKLVAARDRLGEKPVVYSELSGDLVLASEIKALLALGASREIDQDGLSAYLSCGYIPAPLTIYKHIRKLRAGHMLVYQDGALAIRPYWRLVTTPQRSAPAGELAEEFNALFADAVRMRMVADVPLGVFLSGGVDSSAVTAEMARATNGLVRTFTVGFHGETDERPYARMVADRYGTTHAELFAVRNLEADFESIYSYLDEPFGDSSVIPTYAVAKVAREHVTVALTGDGGDELFAGYPMYVDQKYRSRVRMMTPIRRWTNRQAISLWGRDFVSTWPCHSPRALASWQDTRAVFQADELRGIRGDLVDRLDAFFRDRAAGWAPADSLTTAFQYDIEFYLPDDLLKKVDMASMRASLECRAPFLDHRLVEWSLRLPPGIKLHKDEPKAFLKQALQGRLPPPVLRRSKQGFGAPIGDWLRGELRTMALDLTATGCRADQIIPRAATDAARRALMSAEQPLDHRTYGRLWLLMLLETWLAHYG